MSMEYARAKKAVCLECEHARQKFKESCYCVKYGIIIG